ncbi:MAG: DUF1844 domain-containing protein [Balneolales bacterium]|nr:DUF1844 domain-containing protein [Balneolales bacterium]
MLVQQHERIAKINLGEIPNPVHNLREVDLKAARFAIDTIHMLRDYTTPSLTSETKEYIESVCTQLSSSLEKAEKSNTSNPETSISSEPSATVLFEQEQNPKDLTQKKLEEGFTPVTAAGGVLYKKKDGKTRVLLIYRNQKWDLPKGKINKGEDIENCAMREVSEEVGIVPPEITHDLGTTFHSYEDKHGAFFKTTYWFAMTSEAKKFSPEKAEGITKVCWVDLEEAMRLVDFDNLKAVLDRFNRIVANG